MKYGNRMEGLASGIPETKKGEVPKPVTSFFIHTGVNQVEHKITIPPSLVHMTNGVRNGAYVAIVGYTQHTASNDVQKRNGPQSIVVYPPRTTTYPELNQENAEG